MVQTLRPDALLDSVRTLNQQEIITNKLIQESLANANVKRATAVYV